MTERKFLRIFKKHNQHHILDHYKNLSPQKQNTFLQGLEGLDFDLIFALHKDFCHKQTLSRITQDIRPASIITIPTSSEEKAFKEKARTIGESLIRKEKIAALIVAGGQGSRLGFEGPKGTFPITPVEKKTLFQLFSESLQAMSMRYHTTIPLLIMTSIENHQDTLNFFESHNFFGLARDSIHFFQQGMLPSITPDSKLLLRDETNLFMNPDGHGGSLKALYDSGLLTYLIEKGVSELFYCQIDNPLVRIADPVFLGYHIMMNADISTKVVRRINIKEKVGVYVSVNGRDTIIEYSDLSPEKMSALDDHGDILYWAGNTAIHVLGLPFIRRLTQRGFALLYHCAEKSVQAIGPNGKLTKTQCWKFETFVFDAISLTEKTCCMEVARNEEFSPVKNREGADSPETASRAMNNLYRGWLEETGMAIPPDTQIEISPLFALDKEELVSKLKGSRLDIEGDVYLEEK